MSPPGETPKSARNNPHTEVTFKVPKWALQALREVDLSTAQAAHILGTTPSSLKRSEVPFERTSGGHRRYSLGSVLDLLFSLPRDQRLG